MLCCYSIFHSNFASYYINIPSVSLKPAKKTGLNLHSDVMILHQPLSEWNAQRTERTVSSSWSFWQPRGLQAPGALRGGCARISRSSLAICLHSSQVKVSVAFPENWLGTSSFFSAYWRPFSPSPSPGSTGSWHEGRGQDLMEPASALPVQLGACAGCHTGSHPEPTLLRAWVHPGRTVWEPWRGLGWVLQMGLLHSWAVRVLGGREGGIRAVLDTMRFQQRKSISREIRDYGKRVRLWERCRGKGIVRGYVKMRL